MYVKIWKCWVSRQLPVITYGYESWSVKKAECRRIDAFELWCWRRLLRVSWTARKSNQSISREINLEYLLEGLMLKLKLKTPGFWSSDAKSRLTRKVPDAGENWGQKEKRASEEEMAGWHHRCNGHELGQTSGDGEGQGGLLYCSPWGSQRVQHDWVTEQQQYLQCPNHSFFSYASASWRMN